MAKSIKLIAFILLISLIFTAAISAFAVGNSDVSSTQKTSSTSNGKKPKPTPTPTATPIPTSTPTSTPTPIPTPTPTPVSKKVLGFTTYYYDGDLSSYNSMVNNATEINEIATATHIVDGVGNITGTVPTSQVTYANGNSISPYLMIGNNFSGSIAKTLLESASNRQNFINNIITIVANNQYKGVNIDIEGVYAADRNYYTTMIQELYNALKPLGYTVTASVPAKTADNSVYTWNYAYDYVAISSSVDKLVIMAYDEHYPGGSAGPVASINWVKSVLNYTLTVVPKEKIRLGMAAYGYDWSTNGTKAYSINGIYNLASSNGATIQWDMVSQCPYFAYTDASRVQHTVWFENAQSLGYKLDLVNQASIDGIAIWRLGLENVDYWNMIKSKFN
jgi:spore germination protein YaaH